MSRILLIAASAVMVMTLGQGLTKSVTRAFEPVHSALSGASRVGDCRASGNCFAK